jgi:thiol-disulfide isomerase/thioredoxin
MLSKPVREDCGCGGGKYNCVSRNTFARIIKQELKRLDCGCGCKGVKGFMKKYGGSILKPCPPGFRNDGLTCLEECKPGEVDDGLFCRDTNPPGPGWINDGLTFRDTNPPGPGWVNDGLTFRNTNCPPGWVNDGLTCRNPIVTHVDPCPAGWESDPLTCRKPIVTQLDDCPGGFRTEPLTCMKDLRCWQTGNPWKPVWDPGHQRTHCEGPESRSRNPRTSGGEIISRNPRTTGGEVQSQEIRNQEIRGHPTRPKRVEGRVDFDVLIKELDKGVSELFSKDGALARAFDPEKNGVAAAFRKFGDDMKRVLEEVGNQIKEGFKRMGEAAKAAFEQMARDAEAKFKAFGDDFVRMMKDPDFWVEAIGIMAMIGGAALSIAVSVGTLGIGAPAAAGIMAAAAMAGPAARMIASAAKNEPIDALDIAAIVVAGATAAIPGMSGMAATALKVGTTAASYAISAAKIGQDLGLIPSTCVANCPPPPNFDPEPPIDPQLPPVNPPPAGQKSDEEILALAPPCTFFRVVGKPTQPPPCNEMKRATRNGPPYYTEEEWIAKYREDNYGTNPVGPGNILTTEEDKDIKDAVNVPKPEEPPIIIGDLTMEEINLDFGDMPEINLDLGDIPTLDLDFGEMPTLDLNLGDMPTLDLNLGEAPALDLNLGDMPTLDLNLGDMPTLDLNLGDMPTLDLNLGEVPALDLGEAPTLDLNLGDMPTLDLNLGEVPALDLNLGEAPTLDLGEAPTLDLNLGDMPTLDLNLGKESVLDLVETPAVETEILDVNDEETPEILDPNDDKEVVCNYKPVQKTTPKPPPLPSRNEFNAKCYADNYPDVKAFYKIVDTNELTEKNRDDLLLHWNVYGKAQNRLPGCVTGGRRGSGTKSLTLYHADWCHFCKKLMPTWKKLGSSYKGIPIIAIEEKQTKFPVDGYPTIIYRDGSYMEKYTGPRTKSGIEKFLKNKL